MSAQGSRRRNRATSVGRASARCRCFASRSGRRVDDALALGRVDELDHDADDLARRAELPVLARGVGLAQEMLEDIAHDVGIGAAAADGLEEPVDARDRLIEDGFLLARQRRNHLGQSAGRGLELIGELGGPQQPQLLQSDAEQAHRQRNRAAAGGVGPRLLEEFLDQGVIRAGVGDAALDVGAFEIDVVGIDAPGLKLLAYGLGKIGAPDSLDLEASAGIEHADQQIVVSW